MECYFCMLSDGVTEISRNTSEGRLLVRWQCPRCGPIYVSDLAIDSYFLASISENDKKKISICLRNDYERRDPDRSYVKIYNRIDLMRFIETYREMDAIEKMDNALLIFDRKTKFIGDIFNIDYKNDYPLYHCIKPSELVRIVEFLHDNGFIKGEGVTFSVNGNMLISAKGYERLREVKKLGVDSRQCFVAMWLTSEMNDVFNKAIKLAIEYLEEGKIEPKFKALRIDNKEHTNDINDEIISEIRRSRFMVCDLTGYRGGVYWEAGFAYGLGLEVIYTCREDWTRTRDLDLYDKNRKKVDYKQEGIHFDLEHRNRIPWKMDDLSTFRDKLTNRIKAVIV